MSVNAGRIEDRVPTLGRTDSFGFDYDLDVDEADEAEDLWLHSPTHEADLETGLAQLALGSSQGTREGTDTETNPWTVVNEIWCKGEHKKGVWSLTTDNDSIYSGSYDRSICQWKADGTFVARYRPHKREVLSLTCVDGKLVSGSWDHEIRS